MLLRPENAAAAPVRMLRAPSVLLLLGPRMLLLRLLERACAWARLAACERDGGSTMRVLVLTLVACSTVGTKPGDAGAPDSASIGC
jgi:hypothetical protein